MEDQKCLIQLMEFLVIFAQQVIIVLQVLQAQQFARVENIGTV